MRRIVQLSDLIANQIAAGEVVERPASVIKELIENSIDAHATRIEIELSGVGANRLCIRDNGEGITRDDLPLAFMRHATSKIRTAQDLFGIQSLGFRGEALASIASIAKCTLKSKPQDAEQGWEIQVSPEGFSEIRPAAITAGTTVEVLDLFYNTPVRRKFLKSEKTENLAIEELLKKFVLANPEIEFSLKQDHKPVKHYPRCKNTSTWLSKVTGLAFMEAAVPVDVQGIGLSMRGWLAKPQFARRQSDLQYFFVNNRIIRDKAINHAIKSVYLEQADWIEGTYPAYVLYLTLPAKDVDVNVHPTKQEVRFTQSRLVYDFVASMTRKSLNTVAVSVPHLKKSLPSKRFGAPSQINLKENTQKTLSILNRERFFLFEQDEEVTIVDLWKAQSYLIAHYFKHQPDIPTKALLFPQIIDIKTVPEAFALLTTLGFDWMIEKNKVHLYKQPRILASKLSDTHWQQFILFSDTQPTREQVIDWLAENAIGDFSILTKQQLINLMKAIPRSLQFKQTHEEMAQLIESQALEI